MLLAVQLLGPTGRPSRLQSFQTSPPPFGQPARDTTPVQIQQIRDLQNPPSLFVGLDSPEAHVRSEEHTSELQSPCNLVCRLLLEKKKKKLYTSVIISK